MKNRYSEAFMEQALIKVYSRGDRTIKSVADELNINNYTIKNWKATLCEIEWVVEFQFSAQKINHVDKIPHISVASGASFG